MKRFSFKIALLFLLFGNSFLIAVENISFNQQGSFSQAELASEYNDFLNVASIVHQDDIYNEKMASSFAGATILRLGTPGNYQYSFLKEEASKLIFYVSLWDQARFWYWEQHHEFSEEGSQELLKQELLSRNIDPLLKSNIIPLIRGSSTELAGVALSEKDGYWNQPRILAALFIFTACGRAGAYEIRRFQRQEDAFSQTRSPLETDHLIQSHHETLGTRSIEQTVSQTSRPQSYEEAQEKYKTAKQESKDAWEKWHALSHQEKYLSALPLLEDPKNRLDEATKDYLPFYVEEGKEIYVQGCFNALQGIQKLIKNDHDLSELTNEWTEHFLKSQEAGTSLDEKELLFIRRTAILKEIEEKITRNDIHYHELQAQLVLTKGYEQAIKEMDKVVALPKKGFGILKKIQADVAACRNDAKNILGTEKKAVRDQVLDVMFKNEIKNIASLSQNRGDRNSDDLLQTIAIRTDQIKRKLIDQYGATTNVLDQVLSSQEWPKNLLKEFELMQREVKDILLLEKAAERVTKLHQMIDNCNERITSFALMLINDPFFVDNDPVLVENNRKVITEAQEAFEDYTHAHRKYVQHPNRENNLLPKKYVIEREFIAARIKFSSEDHEGFFPGYGFIPQISFWKAMGSACEELEYRINKKLESVQKENWRKAISLVKDAKNALEKAKGSQILKQADSAYGLAGECLFQAAKIFNEDQEGAFQQAGDLERAASAAKKAGDILNVNLRRGLLPEEKFCGEKFYAYTCASDYWMKAARIYVKGNQEELQQAENLEVAAYTFKQAGDEFPQEFFSKTLEEIEASPDVLERYESAFITLKWRLHQANVYALEGPEAGDEYTREVYLQSKNQE